MLEVHGLRKVYRSGGRETEALRDVTFRVERGDLVCLVGPSGCGKTTLLRCLGGLLEPTAGTVRVDGTGVHGPPPGLAMVFQEYGRSLFPWMSVRDNVALPLKQKRIPRDRRAALVDEALASVGLTGTEGAYPWQLSGGMQQRVALARAVALTVPLPAERDQLHTRADPRFAVLRTRVYEQIQAAKRGVPAPGAAGSC